MQVSQLHCSLRDGVHSSSAGSVSSGGTSGYGFALADSPDSVAALYREWKANTLTRSILRDYSSARLDSFFESRGLARDAVFLFSLLSPACKFLDSRRAARPVSGFPVESPCVGPVSPRGAALDGEEDENSEHCPPPRDGKVWTHPSQPDGSQRLLDQTGLQEIAHGAASVNVEHAPSPGFSSSTSKRKFSRGLDERAGQQCENLDPTLELASSRGIWLSSTSSQSRQSLQSPPVRGRPGGSDGDGCPSLPPACPVTSEFSSQDR